MIPYITPFKEFRLQSMCLRQSGPGKGDGFPGKSSARSQRKNMGIALPCRFFKKKEGL